MKRKRQAKRCFDDDDDRNTLVRCLVLVSVRISANVFSHAVVRRTDDDGINLSEMFH